MQHTAAFLKLVDDSRKRIKETNVQEVKRKIDASEKFHLVDCREDSEWASGHIPGAIHLCRGVIERDIEKTIPDTKAPIIIYCGGGFRSVLAADNVQKMGYTNVLSMGGGWKGWNEAGFPVAKD